MAGPSPPLPDDGVYRAILVVLVISVIGGAILALAGEFVFDSQALGRAGGWLAVVCGAIYFVFRWLGRREARRRAAERDAQDRPPS